MIKILTNPDDQKVWEKISFWALKIEISKWISECDRKHVNHGGISFSFFSLFDEKWSKIILTPQKETTKPAPKEY